MADDGTKPDGNNNPQPTPEGAGWKEVIENGHRYVVNEETGAKFFDVEYVEKVRTEAETRRKKLEELQAEKETERQKQLEEQQKFKELYEETKAKHEQTVAEYEQAKQQLEEIAQAKEARRQEMLAKLPKEKQEIYKDATEAIIQDQLNALNVPQNPDQGKPDLRKGRSKTDEIRLKEMYPSMEK